MRFRDIKTFPRCPYRVDVSWIGLESHIEPERMGLTLDLDPDFQRAHVWTSAQQTAYVEYILQGGTSGCELYFNCAGWQKDWRGPYVIVDGKQRLEAVRRFMRGEIPAFGALRPEYADEPDMLIARFSWNIAALETRAEVSENPDISFLVAFQGTLQEEQELHCHYQDYRIRGEWFRLTASHISEITIRFSDRKQLDFGGGV